METAKDSRDLPVPAQAPHIGPTPRIRLALRQGKRMGRGPILTRPKQAHIAVEQEDPKEILVFIYMYVFMYNKLFYNSC